MGAKKRVETKELRAQIEFECTRLRRHYSGELSKDFWMMVNSLPEPHRTEMYTAGCALQNHESLVIHLMGCHAPGFVNDKDKVGILSGRERFE